MGRTMRWLKRILGGRREAKDQKDSEKSNNGEIRDKKRWSFGNPKSSVGHCQETKQSFILVTKAVNDHDKLEGEAAVTIQKIFRGHLARKALRALKSLVKIQALVRGYLVRKQTARTLRRLQSLMQIQSSKKYLPKSHLSSCPRKSSERVNCETRIKHLVPAHNRRLSSTLDSPNSGADRSTKIIEMDTCQLRSRSSRLSTKQYVNQDELAPGMLDSSPIFLKSPFRLSLHSTRKSRDYIESYSKTTYNTPRFIGFCTDSPITPAKSMSAVEGVLRRILTQQGRPNYMAETRSSVAKIRSRSQSVPKERLDESGKLRRDSVDLVIGQRRDDDHDTGRFGNRLSCSEGKGGICKNARIADLERELARDYYLDRMW